MATFNLILEDTETGRKCLIFRSETRETIERIVCDDFADNLILEAFEALEDEDLLSHSVVAVS
jgi:hypothetical protein